VNAEIIIWITFISVVVHLSLKTKTAEGKQLKPVVRQSKCSRITFCPGIMMKIMVGKKVIESEITSRIRVCCFN